jgi:O-antigen/teichoic acid export membrane protein
MIGLLYFYGNDLVILVAGHLVSTALITGILYIYSLKFIDNSKPDPNCIPYGYFLSLTNVAGTIASNIDKIVIGIFLGPTDLAVYTIGIALPVRIKDFFKLSLSSITPKLCQDSITGRNIVDTLKKLTLPIISFLLIISIIYWIFIGPLIILFFGPSYSDAIIYSKILILMIILSFPSVLLGTYAISKQKKVAIILGYHIFPFLKIFIFIICTYFFGMLGAVWALNIEMGVQALLIGIGIIHEGKSPIDNQLS